MSDVIFCILSEISYRTPENIRSLQSACLCNRDIQQEAEALLYSSIWVFGPTAMTSLLSALTTRGRGIHRRNSVKTLIFGQSQEMYPADDVFTLLLLLENLVDLELRVVHGVPLPITRDLPFRLRRFSSIFDPIRGNVKDFLATQPSIRYLRVPYEQVTSTQPRAIPLTLLPNLVDVDGSSTSLMYLLPGRPITKVHCERMDPTTIEELCLHLGRSMVPVTYFHIHHAMAHKHRPEWILRWIAQAAPHLQEMYLHDTSNTLFVSQSPSAHYVSYSRMIYS
ncbi:hypothetical protein FRB93_011474 [Tulasnella sp. JGI-2019a]|nr:hypothetical protein FRB93_011474 [Tulasnella sp. JGI-2019a]